jgi:hypothetical protein
VTPEVGDIVVALDPPGMQPAPAAADDESPRWVVVAVDPPEVTVRRRDDPRRVTTVPLDLVKAVPS